MVKAEQILSDKEKKPEKQDQEAATIPEVKKRENHLGSLLVNQHLSDLEMISDDQHVHEQSQRTSDLEKIVEEANHLTSDQETRSQRPMPIRDHFVAQAKDTMIREKHS